PNLLRSAREGTRRFGRKFLDQAQIARDKTAPILVAAAPAPTMALEITGAATTATIITTRRTMAARKRTRGEKRMLMLRPIRNYHQSAFQSERQRGQIRLDLDSDVVAEVEAVVAVVEEEEEAPRLQED